MAHDQLSVKMQLDAWYFQVKAFDTLLGTLSDKDLMAEIAPGRNRGIYLLGHLACVHDLMGPILMFGEVMFPDLKRPFLDEADKAVSELPPLYQLREQWKIVNNSLATHFAQLTPEEWFTRHNSVSEEDFMREPHRNKLNLLISRTAHLAYHRGQMALLPRKG
jgi:hypothetical protein